MTTDAGQQLLADLSEADLNPANTLKWVERLRVDYPTPYIHALLTTVQLREAAQVKFGADAARMYFTEAALQQASDPLVRAYRRKPVRPDERVLDLCCGVGSDALAFAKTGVPVLGVDIDPIRIRMAQLNAAVLNVSDARFVVADVTRRDTIEDYAASTVFFDPGRRTDTGRRIFDVSQYLPPLDTIQLYADVPRRLVKISPGVDLAQLSDLPARVEFVSISGALKEALLHLGGVDDQPSLMATLLLDDQAQEDNLRVLHWHAQSLNELPAIQEPRRWLVEPDPALIRAGFVQHAALAFDGVLLDETIAYFTAGQRPESPWVRAWEVLDWMPFNMKRLRTYLRQRDVGQITVKKRGSAVSPEALQHGLKLKGEASRTIVLTRLKGQQIAIICADYTA
ncbi:MAG: THUMP-like domain-containing protein [Chloroflexota bacterium]